MIPIPADLLKRLRLEQAIKDEADSWQSLLPQPPGWDQAISQSKALAQWLHGQLLAGLPCTSEVVNSAWKASHGVRPVPIWGFAERVTYRAIVDFILRNELPLDRTAEAYLAFISGPAKYGQSLAPKTKTTSIASIFNSPVKYIVQADITAFYECIDHGVLAKELLTRTGDFAAIQCLMSLLSEVKGREFGLPQLLEPSDRLSEIYIDTLERDLLRRGWAVWRFNDDFRIAVLDFAGALAALEDMSSSARELGLTLSEMKTTTPRYSTYLFNYFGLQVDSVVPEDLKLQQAEDAVGDYTEGVGETDPTWAVNLIVAAKTPDGKGDQRSEEGIEVISAK